jgi:competence protein ComEA
VPDQESPRHPAPPPGALDDRLDPDPAFWGPPERPRRRSTPRAPHRLPAAGEGRAALAVVAVVVVSAALLTYRASVAPGTGTTSAATPPAAAGLGRARVVVNVAGAVTRPGVVRLPATDRVVDALDAAGGALASADLDQLNLAARLHDGEQVLVPVGSTTTTTTTTAPPTSTSAPPPG